MNLKLLSNCMKQQWNEIFKIANNSIIILDDSSAECLHWHGGLKLLFDNGAIAVENFSPFVTANSNASNVVFVLSSPFTNETKRTIDVILRANSFKQSMVVSSLPLRCLNEEIDSNLSGDVGKILCNWMEKMVPMAHIRHIPFFAAHISNNLFILPSFSQKFSVFKCGIAEMNRNRTDEVTMKSIPEEMQHSIRQLACCLTSLLDTLQVRGEMFSLGPFSHILSNEMESLAQQQKKSYGHRTSVVFVDRLLDLAGPCSQSHETMLDQILLTFPRLTGHTFDVGVPLQDLSGCKSTLPVFGRPILAPGCLAHKNSALEENTLNSILYKAPRDVLVDINHSLANFSAKENISLEKKSLKLTAEEVKNRIFSYKCASQINGFVEQAWAVVGAEGQDTLSAVERALLEYFVQSSEEVLNSIMNMIADKENLNYKMENILVFLAFFYLLSGATDISNESAMQATLMEEFFHDKNREELLSLFVDGEQTDELVLNAVSTLFEVLKKLGTIRRRLKKYPTLFKSGNPAFPAAYNPLLKQILEDMFNPAVQEMTDLAYHSAGLKDYLRTGFSLFVNVAKPQPRSNPVVLMVILGGVTPAEIKLFQESQRGESEVILLCTGLLTPNDVITDLGLIVKELHKNL